MAIKTFNIDHKVYKKFSEYCKKSGISMSKKVEKFIKGELEKLGEIEKFEKLSQKIIPEKIQEEAEHSFKKYC